MAIAHRLLQALGTAAVLVLAPCDWLVDAAQSPAFGVGHAATPPEIRAIDIDVAPDGKGLPPGGASAAAGKEVYTRRCETCHGSTGTEGPQDILVMSDPFSTYLDEVGAFLRC